MKQPRHVLSFQIHLLKGDFFTKSRVFPALLIGVECLIYIAFLILDASGSGADTIWLKYAGILLCLIYALLQSLAGGDFLVFLALLFTAAADWFLLVKNELLILGVLLFLFVQTFYLLRLYRDRGTCGWLLRLILAVCFEIFLIILNMVSPLNLLAFFYFSQLLANMILAWKGKLWLFAVGLTLFVGCDLCVGLFNSGMLTSVFYNVVSLGMWFFYLPSQVLIALSGREVHHENQ